MDTIKNKEGYDEAVLDEYSADKNTIRGREQLLIEHHKAQEISGNKLNGNSKRNKKRKIYIAAALETFRELLMSSMHFQI